MRMCWVSLCWCRRECLPVLGREFLRCWRRAPTRQSKRPRPHCALNSPPTRLIPLPRQSTSGSFCSTARLTSPWAPGLPRPLLSEKFFLSYAELPAKSAPHRSKLLVISNPFTLQHFSAAYLEQSFFAFLPPWKRLEAPLPVQKLWRRK